MNNYELLEWLKKKRKFMTERQIRNELKLTQPTLNKKLNSWVKFRKLEVKKKVIKVGTARRPVKHYRYRPSLRRKK